MKTNLIILALILCNMSYPQKNEFPEWAKGIVWYQIFPERFANGDKSNDPTADKVFINSNAKPDNWKITDWTANWFSQQDWESDMDRTFNVKLQYRRYGGDLQGIINRLDYLAELGIQGIYLNPVFEAVSLHKYDGSTFHHIDVNFGPDPKGDLELIASEVPEDPNTWKWTSADLLFLKLIEEVHNRGMFIIIDGVFNHTGVQFWAFQDIVKNQEKSKYADWFLIKSFDDPNTEENEFDYKGWWNIKSLPEFYRDSITLHPEVKEYVFHATNRWMSPILNGKKHRGIDGWRLDVARDVPIGFWREWSGYVKKIKPDALIIGELWELSPDFVRENGVFDALMNYNFAYPTLKLFVNKKKRIKVSEFISDLQKVDQTYPLENLFLLQNLLSSHDTERLSSLVENPNRNYDRDADERNQNYNPGKPSNESFELMKLLVAFQITYRGAPMIYYGDEVGMWGADDPHCRKPMVFSDIQYDDEVIDARSGFKAGLGTYRVKPDLELFNFYKSIIQIRRENPELVLGDLKFNLIDDKNNAFSFIRQYKGEKTEIFFNLGSKEIAIDFNKINATEDYGRDYNLIFYNRVNRAGDSTNHEFNTSNNKLNLPAQCIVILKKN